MLANYSVDREETFAEDPEEDEDYDESESKVGLGVYLRGGVDVRVHKGGYVGLGTRTAWTHLDLSEVGGPEDATGVAGFITYTVEY